MFLPGANHLYIASFRGVSHGVADFTTEGEVLPSTKRIRSFCLLQSLWGCH